MSLLSAEATDLDSFEAFASELRIEDGTPFVLHPYQREMLADYFDGARETAVIIPKKNGKSTTVAALALYHLVVTPNAECIIVAAARDQAEVILRQARMFYHKSEPLQRLMVIRQRSILSTLDEGRIRVLASDEDTADGVIPTLAIVDELHRHKSAELYGVLRDGLGPRGGRMVTISTAASALDSPLGQLRTHAHSLPGFTRQGKHNHVRSSDGVFAFHEWCLDAEDDVEDMAVVKQANPAPWQTEDELAKRRNSGLMTPWGWLRFACGIWTEGEEPWLEPAAWDDLARPGLEIPEGEQVWLGVDIGVRGDSTAIAMVAEQDETLLAKATIMPPPVSLEDVEDAIRNLAGRYQVQAIAFDPWSFRRSAEMLEAEGLPMIEVPQSPERMHIVSAELFRLIETGVLRHDGDPNLRAHVLAGVTKETERGWRLRKDPKSRRPIDALIALAMACYVATVGQSSEILVGWGA